MANQVDYRDPTPNKFPQDYDPIKVDPRVKLRSDSIKHKQKGVDTREAMYQALEIGSVTANEAKETAIDTASRQDAVDQSQSDFEDRYNEQIAGNTDLDEVIDSRKPKSKDSYATLGERLNAMPMNSDLDLLIGDSPQDVDGGIPDYNATPLSALKSSIDPLLFNVGFGTDYHYGANSPYTPDPSTGFTEDDGLRFFNSGLRKTLNILSLTDKLSAVVFNGDNVEQPFNEDMTKQRIAMLKQHYDFATTVFSATQCPAFLLKGNHDNNYNLSAINRTFTNVIHDEDFKKAYQQNGLYGEQRLDGSNYYYMDFTDKKVRMIGLDSSDMPETVKNGVMEFNRFDRSGFQQAQLNWLANEALQVPTDYTVLITMHWPVNHTVYDYDDASMLNHGLLKQILEDFVTGSPKKSGVSTGELPVNIEYEFSTAGNLAAVLSGHRHVDQIKTVNGINYVLTRCSLICGDNVIGNQRLTYDGQPAEDAFDIASLNTATRTLAMMRFGAGSEDPNYAKRVVNY